ncbi:autotransporter domain-containing protein [Steroidobacter sp. S1-65]|uniref:Autotransporter domain-containing protein n=1 Tax=Steroidobacter gossypii TaxID=2805490 RepID=A0ABS1WTE0_9GAMM|nr:autotransporter outer membrane beta-barrel domain-containing protein [Steroidobacter gossypii]MBM0104248.1 autotransporter domain-containing protein [Steroidobacter gossypii]
MKVRALGRAGGSLAAWMSGAALLAMAPLAHAVPPTFSSSVNIPIPAMGDAVIVNLRQAGAVSGSAPISIDTGQGVVLLNGEPTALAIQPYDPLGGDTGSVCVIVFNVEYSPSAGDTLTAPLTAANGQQETGSTGFPGIQIVNAPGPGIVTPGNEQQEAACEDPNQPPVVAINGGSRAVSDTDGAPGENVTFAATASDPEGELLQFAWYVDESDEPISTAPNPTIALPDGVSRVRVVVTDQSDGAGEDEVTITVGNATGPTANAGGDRTVADTDGENGEDVTLDASLSTDADGAIVSYRWSRITDGENEELLGTSASPTLQVRLPDGDNLIRLLITDNSGLQSADSVTITIGAGTITRLSELPNLSPNQRRVAVALDRICGELRDLSSDEGAALTADQQDLLVRCNGLQIANTTSNQVAALEELVADDFAVARTQTLLFANTQYASVMDRLMALRGGARGLSLAGLNIIVDGKPVPLAQLQDMVKGLLGGGASADEPGGLLSDKWGMWARGNFSFGDKDRSANAPAFDADQWALVGGLDYRFNDKWVGGLSLAYGQSTIEFDPREEGGLDTDTWAASLYGSVYAARDFYFDAIVNVANAKYGADRNITYVDGTGLVNVDAHGDTDGMTYSAGVSGGYDFLIGGLTLSPNLGVFYIDATIDSFTERGAGGLNLIYDEQSFQSFTGNVGFRATYAWNLSWGVLLPHLRVDYVREFKDDVDVFGVRFAADPNATSTPPILVETDNPDQSYWRLATGMSAQFIHGISAYVEYQRLESFEFISFQDVSLGLRLQRSF